MYTTSSTLHTTASRVHWRQCSLPPRGARLHTVELLLNSPGENPGWGKVGEKEVSGEEGGGELVEVGGGRRGGRRRGGGGGDKEKYEEQIRDLAII